MIDQYNGSIYLACPFDFETKSSFSLYLNVTDSFESGLMDAYAFTVNVLDVNDEIPVFSAATYSGTIQDGQTNPTTVTMTSAISATDADTYANYSDIT